jgi:hypothetical protein
MKTAAATGCTSTSHTFSPHPEEPRACAASRRMAAGRFVAILRDAAKRPLLRMRVALAARVSTPPIGAPEPPSFFSPGGFDGCMMTDPVAVHANSEADR